MLGPIQFKFTFSVVSLHRIDFSIVLSVFVNHAEKGPKFVQAGRRYQTKPVDQWLAGFVVFEISVLPYYAL